MRFQLSQGKAKGTLGQRDTRPDFGKAYADCTTSPRSAPVFFFTYVCNFFTFSLHTCTRIFCTHVNFLQICIFFCKYVRFFEEKTRIPFKTTGNFCSRKTTKKFPYIRVKVKEKHCHDHRPSLIATKNKENLWLDPQIFQNALSASTAKQGYNVRLGMDVVGTCRADSCAIERSWSA